jgi:peptidoglycan/LPS O-acetylase OafA/YrhL
MLRIDRPPKGSASVHLDALRGFAAFSVLLNHWRDAFFVDYRTIAHHNPLAAASYLAAGLGHQWVIVFFVLSGYLVGGSVLRSVSSGRWSWRKYLLARLTRLYIVLLPALLLGGAIDWAGMHLAGANAIYSGQSGMHALTENVHGTLTLPTLAENALFLQTISLPGRNGRAVATFGSNGPLWSLSNEFWYYMAFPVLALLLFRGRSWQACAVWGLVLLVWGWFVGREIVLLGIPWLMGVGIVLLPPFPARGQWIRRTAVAVALVLVVGGFVLGKKLNSLPSDILLGFLVTLLIWVMIHCATAPLPSTYMHLAQRSARSSYTLYLVHLPLVIFLKTLLHLPRAVPSWHVIAVSATLLFGVLLYAQLVYEIFEKNTEKVRAWIKPHVISRPLG